MKKRSRMAHFQKVLNAQGALYIVVCFKTEPSYLILL